MLRSFLDFSELTDWQKIKFHVKANKNDAETVVGSIPFISSSVY